MQLWSSKQKNIHNRRKIVKIRTRNTKGTGTFLKKTPWLGVKDLVRKFEFIELLSSHYTITDLCSCLKVNRSSYYYWENTKEIRLEKELPDKTRIEAIFNNRKKFAGYRTIRMDLENKYGVIMNTKKIRRLMNKYGIKTQVRRKNPYKEIMKKTQEHATCANILNREFKQTKPLTTLCTDITYLYYGRCEKAYLSAVKDISTGEIVTYKVAKHLTMPIVLDTINNLKNVISLDINTFRPRISLYKS